MANIGLFGYTDVAQPELRINNVGLLDVSITGQGECRQFSRS